MFVHFSKEMVEDPHFCMRLRVLHSISLHTTRADGAILRATVMLCKLNGHSFYLHFIHIKMKASR